MGASTASKTQIDFQHRTHNNLLMSLTQSNMLNNNNRGSIGGGNGNGSTAAVGVFDDEFEQDFQKYQQENNNYRHFNGREKG